MKRLNYTLDVMKIAEMTGIYPPMLFGTHPYTDEFIVYDYAGVMEDLEGKTMPLYNTPDGHTVSLETMIRRESKRC